MIQADGENYYSISELSRMFPRRDSYDFIRAVVQCRDIPFKTLKKRKYYRECEVIPFLTPGAKQLTRKGFCARIHKAWQALIG